jgi:hypothetical protein
VFVDTGQEVEVALDGVSQRFERRVQGPQDRVIEGRESEERDQQYD